MSSPLKLSPKWRGLAVRVLVVKQVETVHCKGLNALTICVLPIASVSKWHR
jgi:hypothetical protein